MTTKAPRKPKKIAPTPKRNLTPEECLEFQEISRVIHGKRWEVAQIAGNTALIPNGQALAEQMTAVLTVLDDVGKQWISRKLAECGYPNGTKCELNVTTGKITLQDEA